MPVLLRAWCVFAATLLIVCLLVHLSTFLGIDPMERFPGVMFLHLAIFPPFIAAIYYASRVGGEAEGQQDRVFESAPLGLRILTGAFFAYAFVNFGLFMILNEGGVPDERDGKYVLHSHGTVLRELTEDEYHRKRAYVVRGFSGHWMLFASASLTLLVGAARLRRRSAAEAAPVAPAPTAADIVEEEKAADKAEPPPEPTTVLAGCVSLVLYVACLAMILSGLPALSVVVVPVLTTAAVLAIRRRRGFPHRSFESCIGCLTVFPNALIASRMGWLAAEFIYLTLYAGLGAALSHEVAVTFPSEGPSQLSNGELLDNRVWAALMLFVTFPLFAAGTIGLCYLAEHVGRLVEVRRREQSPDPPGEPLEFLRQLSHGLSAKACEWVCVVSVRRADSGNHPISRQPTGSSVVNQAVGPDRDPFSEK